MRKLLFVASECIGCGSCVDILPAYFAYAESGRAMLYGARTEKGVQVAEVFSEDEEFALQVTNVCPTKCIKM